MTASFDSPPSSALSHSFAALGEVEETGGFGLGFHWLLGFRRIERSTWSLLDSGHCGYSAPLTTTFAFLRATKRATASGGGFLPSLTPIWTPTIGPFPKNCTHPVILGFNPAAVTASRICLEKLPDSTSAEEQKTLMSASLAKGLNASIREAFCASERDRTGGLTIVTDWLKFPFTLPVLMFPWLLGALISGCVVGATLAGIGLASLAAWGATSTLESSIRALVMFFKSKTEGDVFRNVTPLMVRLSIFCALTVLIGSVPRIPLLLASGLVAGPSPATFAGTAIMMAIQATQKRTVTPIPKPTIIPRTLLIN